MKRQRWIQGLGAVILVAGAVLGLGYLLGRPDDADNVLHEVPGVDAEGAAQVGATLVLADWDGEISLLDLESGELQFDVAGAWTHWHAGRGPVALITTHMGGATAYDHDGAVLWAVPDRTSGTTRPVAVFADGATVVRDCVNGRGCDYRALETDGRERWSQPEGDGRAAWLAWYAEEVELGSPNLLPSVHVTQARSADEGAEPQEVLLHDPSDGEGTVLAGVAAAAGDGVVALLDTTDGSCDVTILRPHEEDAPSEHPGVCEGFEDPGLAVLGDNVGVWGAGEQVLIATAGGAGQVATAPDGLVNVDLTAAGLIGLDEISWLFGTNGTGTMEHRVEADLLMAHGAEAIVVTTHRQPWNPFASDSVRHEVLDPVTGEVCGMLEVTSLGSPTPLPGCRAVVADPRAGESYVVGRP